MRETIIYIDCKGNIENNKYLKEKDIEEYKLFLEKVGFTNIEVKNHELSWKNNRSFIEKPTLFEHFLDKN